MQNQQKAINMQYWVLDIHLLIVCNFIIHYKLGVAKDATRELLLDPLPLTSERNQVTRWVTPKYSKITP